MNQKAFIQNRWLYRVLRILAAVMTSLVGLLLIYSTVTALCGDTAVLVDMLDMESSNPGLNMVSQVALVVVSIFAIVTFWLLFRSINKFLKHAELGELFLESAAVALSRMGSSMILLYGVFISFEVFLPMLIEPGTIVENSLNFLMYLVDLNVLTLLIGIVLMALAGALREGREIQDELRQIV